MAEHVSIKGVRFATSAPAAIIAAMTDDIPAALAWRDPVTGRGPTFFDLARHYDPSVRHMTDPEIANEMKHRLGTVA